MCVCSRATQWLALWCVLGAAPLAAQDVELRSLDGAIRLEGTLTAYDGAYYQLTTVYGPLTITAEAVSCAGPGCPDLTSFIAEARIAGEATVVETLLPKLLSGFATARGMALSGPDMNAGRLAYTLTRADTSIAARFTIAPGNSDGGFLALLNGDTDIALTLRPPTPGEARADRDSAPDDPPLTRRVRVIARDALVPVVAPRNPMAAISLVDLAAVYRGEIDNWQALGGPDAPIALHLLSADHGLAQAFIAEILEAGTQDLTPDITTHDSIEALAAAVLRDGYALGMTARSAADAARRLPLVDGCGLTQIADAVAIKSEEYPLITPVHLYLAPRRLPQLVRDFLSWTESDIAAAHVAAAGFVDQRLTRTPLSGQGLRLANAIRAADEAVPLAELQRLVTRLAGAERLSATLRFADGSVDLTAQSRAAVSRLAAAIEAGDFDGRRLLFIGFSDGQGDPAVNLRLSQRRADAVLAAVRTAAHAAASNRVTFEAMAFGQAMPLACDNSDKGRAANRRVEVWLE